MTTDPESPGPAELRAQIAELQRSVQSLARPAPARGAGGWIALLVLLVLLLAGALAWSAGLFGAPPPWGAPRTPESREPAASAAGAPLAAEGGLPAGASDAASSVSPGPPGAPAQAEAEAVVEDEPVAGAAAVPAPDAVDVVAMQERLDSVLAERNELFGQVVRLRNQVLEQEQRINALIQLRDLAVERAEPEPPRVTSTDERQHDPWLDSLHEALMASGLEHLRVVEGRLHAGRMHDILLAELDLMGRTREVRQHGQLELSSEAGAVYLELTTVPDLAGDEASAESAGDGAPAGPTVERIRLARWDAGVWSPTGLTLPSVMLPVEDVEQALQSLLTGQRLEIRGLGGFDGGELIDLELAERDRLGSFLRTIRAPRAVIVGDGPSLHLYDGEVVQDGATRRFYKGRMVVPLPGADHQAWRAAVGG